MTSFFVGLVVGGLRSLTIYVERCNTNLSVSCGQEIEPDGTELQLLYHTQSNYISEVTNPITNFLYVKNMHTIL